jgi:hypothetical protein
VVLYIAPKHLLNHWVRRFKELPVVAEEKSFGEERHRKLLALIHVSALPRPDQINGLSRRIFVSSSIVVCSESRELISLLIRSISSPTYFFIVSKFF